MSRLEEIKKKITIATHDKDEFGKSDAVIDLEWLIARVEKLEKLKEDARRAVQITTAPMTKDPFDDSWKWHYDLHRAVEALKEDS